MTRLIRRTPNYRPVRNTTFDRFFEDFWNTWNDLNGEESEEMHERFATPALDIIDGENEVEIQVDLPGFSPDNVDIEFDKGVLTISANVERTDEDEVKNYTRRERYVGAYRRTLRVPDTIDTENANATFDNGVLHLTLPKKPEAQPKRIPVSSASN